MSKKRRKVALLELSDEDEDVFVPVEKIQKIIYDYLQKAGYTSACKVLLEENPSKTGPTRPVIDAINEFVTRVINVQQQHADFLKPDLQNGSSTNSSASTTNANGLMQSVTPSTNKNQISTQTIGTQTRFNYISMAEKAKNTTTDIQDSRHRWRHFMEINAGKEEMAKRIKMFQQKKKAENSASNKLEFLATQNTEGKCARTNSSSLQRKIQMPVSLVVNETEAPLMKTTEKFSKDSKASKTKSKRSSTDDAVGDDVLERISLMENFLNINPNVEKKAKAKREIYKRLQTLEGRILQVEKMASLKSKKAKQPSSETNSNSNIMDQYEQDQMELEQDFNLAISGANIQPSKICGNTSDASLSSSANANKSTTKGKNKKPLSKNTTKANKEFF